jgi:predicted ABC-type sugar transport system permease subunit
MQTRTFTLVVVAPGTGAVLRAAAASSASPVSTRTQLLDAMKDVIVGKAAYVGRFRQ